MGSRAHQAPPATATPSPVPPFPGSTQGGAAGMVPCPAEIKTFAAFRCLHRHVPYQALAPQASGSTWHGLGRDFNPSSREGKEQDTGGSHRWHGCSKLPALSQAPEGHGPRCFSIRCRCRGRVKLVEGHHGSAPGTARRELAQGKGLEARALLPNSTGFKLAALPGALRSSTPSFAPHPLLLFYLHSFCSRKLCSGKFNGLNGPTERVVTAKQPRAGVNWTLQLFLQKEPREGTALHLILFS